MSYYFNAVHYQGQGHYDPRIYCINFAYQNDHLHGTDQMAMGLRMENEYLKHKLDFLTKEKNDLMERLNIEAAEERQKNYHLGKTLKKFKAHFKANVRCISRLKAENQKSRVVLENIRVELEAEKTHKTELMNQNKSLKLELQKYKALELENQSLKADLHKSKEEQGRLSHYFQEELKAQQIKSKDLEQEMLKLRVDNEMKKSLIQNLEDELQKAKIALEKSDLKTGLHVELEQEKISVKVEAMNARDEELFSQTVQSLVAVTNTAKGNKNISLMKHEKKSEFSLRQAMQRQLDRQGSELKHAQDKIRKQDRELRLLRKRLG